MKPDVVAQFPISSDLVMLNHASFGLATSAITALAEQVRAELEADSLALIDVEALTPRLRDAAAAAATHLELDAGSLVLTANATSGASAIMRSLAPRGRVVVLSTEYASMLRGWQVRCEELGSECLRCSVPLPLQSTAQLLDSLDAQVRGPVDLVEMSLVSSSTAIRFPVEELVAWFKQRGALVVLDIAHGPGHVELHPEAWGVSAMHGTLHKWFPTPRPVGVLWLDDDLRDRIRPSDVSLTCDSPDLVERFAWTGTYDPTPRLCVRAALEQWTAWRAAGDLQGCVELADHASARLEALGVVPTCAPAYLPPRLRAFLVPGVPRETLRDCLDAAKVRGFCGTGPEGQTTLRVATHVFNDEGDVDLLCGAVRAAGGRSG